LNRDSTKASPHRDRKYCAIPSSHRDSFSTKVPGQVPGASSGNAYLLYCRAVRFQADHIPKPTLEEIFVSLTKISNHDSFISKTQEIQAD
jgi:hypothetical protein